MAKPGFLRGREWLIKQKVQVRSKKRVKQMKKAWWSVWRANTVLVDIQEGIKNYAKKEVTHGQNTDNSGTASRLE